MRTFMWAKHAFLGTPYIIRKIQGCYSCEHPGVALNQLVSAPRNVIKSTYSNSSPMEQKHHERYWIAEFKSGNPQALSYVHKLHYHPLCYFAEKLIHEKDEAEDIVAESFIKLWKIHGNFETLQNIKAFLYITTRNACFNYLKQVQRKNSIHKEILYISEEEDKFVLNEMVEAEVLHEVYKEIEELPTKCKRIFKMLYVEGLRSEEIAGRLNISVHTVRAQRARALQLIRVVLLKKRTVLLLLGFVSKWWSG